MYVMSNQWVMPIIIGLLTTCSYATQLVQGPVSFAQATATNTCPTEVTTTFTLEVQTTTYDRANGVFYVGLASGAGAYAISSFSRPVGGQQIPLFKPRAFDTTLADQSIIGIALAAADGSTCSLIAGYATPTDGSSSTSLFVLNQLNEVGISETLLGYEPTLNQDGASINNIVAIDANANFIFAAVSASFINESFGRSADDGIAVAAINRCAIGLTSTTEGLYAICQTAAVPGDNGIKAQAFNDTSPQLSIGGAAVRIQNNSVSFAWDDRLERLYIGVSIATFTSVSAGKGLRSVAVAQVGECPEKGTLTINNIAPDSAFATSQEYIIGAVSNSLVDLELTCSGIAVMHASTGPSYLIVHGSDTTATNQIYALPLVDLCNPTNTTQGTLANKNIFNPATHRFEQAATAPADMTLATDQFARVGNGPLPIQPDHTISGLQVIDDAVYVSLLIPQDDSNETGILYSQAQFDNTGKIISWTAWSKRVWPICGFPDSPSASQVSYFAVDGVTGDVTAIDGEELTVRITRWDEGYTCGPCAQSCSLAATLNNTFCNGTFSVLDLDQSTTAIGQETPYRYALFGGSNIVAFALTSVSRADAAPYDIDPDTDIPYPQYVTQNYCCPEFFLRTELPDDAGCVRTLEFSRVRDSSNNYFFAGTQHGLYAFANTDGQGFEAHDLGPLNEGIFTSGSWQKVAAISDPVVAIRSSGNILYVLTFNRTDTAPIGSTLLSIPYAADLATMFAPANIRTLATSATAPALDTTLLFTDVSILQTNANGATEQLALTTNNGLFQTQAVGGSQTATNQTTAAWTLVDEQQLYYGIGSVDNAAAKTTVWPYSADDACGYKTFQQSSIHQLNGNLLDTTPTFSFIPEFFNYLITACGCCNPADCVYCPDCPATDPIAKRLYEKIVYFWSDGGRRFFILSPINAHLAPYCCNNNVGCCPRSQLRYLQVTPFNSCVWNNNAPCSWELKDCLLRQQSLYYWVRPIGMTGIILAGTQSGVVALE